jgi:hypothetical protein
MKRTMMNMTLAVWTMGGACLALAQQPAGRTFPSASEAGQSLYQAVQSNDEKAIADILGGPTDLASSRNPERDQTDRDLFVRKYKEMHRLTREPDGSITLYLGAENWPFPFPLIQGNGSWRFDSDAGEKEILFRRIGDNELTAIENCEEFAPAKKQFRADSNAGNSTDSSPTSLVAKAASGSAGGDPVLFHGYYFRLLATASPKRGTPGGFTLIAYPVEYRSSGVKTFIVTSSGVVYEKDLGADTAALASGMAAFRKDATWRPAGE